MSPEEQLDEARAKEALREADEANRYFTFLEVATLAARRAREGWTPPEPVVDPDLLAFREWLSGFYPASKANILQGCRDLTADAEAYLAGARMAAEREQERAKVLVELVEDLTTLGSDDSISPIPGVASFTLAKYRGEA